MSLQRQRSFGTAFQHLEFDLSSVDLSTVIAQQRSCTVSKVAGGIRTTTTSTAVSALPPSTAALPSSSSSQKLVYHHHAAAADEQAVKDMLLSGPCAVKHLSAHSTMSANDLAAEASTLGALWQAIRDPTKAAIPRVLAVSPANDGTRGLKAFAMTFFRAAPTQKLFFQYPKGLPHLLVRSIAWQLTRILEGVHAAGFIYRDLKLPNILISTDGLVKLVDFADCERASRCVGPAGTRHVRAPEMVAADSRYGNAVDAFSLGVVLYELVTGRPLLGTFERSLGSEIAQSSNPTLATTLVDFPSSQSVPSDLQMLIRELLEPDPARRLGCVPTSAVAAPSSVDQLSDSARSRSPGLNASPTASGMSTGFMVDWNEVRNHQSLCDVGLTVTHPDDEDASDVERANSARITEIVSEIAEEIDMQLLGL